MNEPIALSPSELLDAIKDLTREGRNDAVIALADANLPEIQSREACAEDAESCRLTMLAHVKRGGSRGSTAVWRVRTLARATAIDWHECVMALVIPEAFALIDPVGTPSNEPSFDEFRVPREALGVLDEVRPFIGSAPGPYSFGPDPSLLARLYHEKRGFLLCALGEYAEAIASYDSALAAAEADTSEHGHLKVRAGRALTIYLWDNDAAESQAAIEETASVAEHPRELEIARIARRNLEVMNAGRRDVIPYEAIGV